MSDDKGSQAKIEFGSQNDMTGSSVSVGDVVGRDKITTNNYNRPRLIVYPAIALIVVLTLTLLTVGLAFMGVNAFGVRQQFIQRGIIDEFPAAQPGETLVVVASFFRTEGVDDTDAHNEIRRAIEAQVRTLGLVNLRVEVASTRLRAEDQAGAAALGQQYAATIVVWGADTKVRVTVSFLNLRQPDFDAAEVKIDETARTQLANPSVYASFVTADLPAQMTFLSLFTVAQTYFSDKNYVEALRVLESAIATLTPATAESEGVAEAYFRKGWLHQELGHDPQRAIDAYDQAIGRDQLYYGAYNNRGNAFAKLGNLYAALADFEQGIALNPNNAAAYIGRGNAHYSQGDMNAALVDYDRAIALNAEFALAYYNRGIVYHKQNNLDSALSDYNQAILLNPTDVRVYSNRGIVHNDQGNSQVALADFDHAIALDPGFVLAYLNRGHIYANAGNLKAALADFDQAIALNPTLAGGYYSRGFIYNEQDNPQQALVDYDKAISLDPGYISAYFNRGGIYKELGETEKAIADFKQMLALSDDPELTKDAQTRLQELVGK